MKLKVSLSKIALGLLSVTIVACDESQELNTKAASIGPNSTRTEVLNVFGPPQKRDFQGQQEVWQYCTSGLESHTYTAITLVAGNVSGLRNYSQVSFLDSCTAWFRDPSFDTPPDTTIEIRNR